MNERTHLQVHAHNAFVGMVLFLIYLAVYVTFVVMSAFAPTTMAKEVIPGINVAVLYGFGLIAAAFVMALLYLVLAVTEKVDTPE